MEQRFQQSRKHFDPRATARGPVEPPRVSSILLLMTGVVVLIARLVEALIPLFTAV
ncbi:hypothetical protein [Sinorhizobium terangae]|uniref:Uncharacterized protein n=1 Tax=Sinorhizobium terangae TaxID=110322 RepID=A0A6N7LML6_SINTE|nr:hypothetical protein [Sinorhizobium terangae]MBB4186221.1 hypothetical protein [Sinorhizobium terangae]MQX15846.1 hypothetical protein [Sinorhizobium terangae]MQX19082.1 hypothetical protein [Sinorhizobium terangae]WFU51121.1 hypothetical protein QA637_21225 [Sinorhizobium terangae]